MSNRCLRSFKYSTQEARLVKHRNRKLTCTTTHFLTLTRLYTEFAFPYIRANGDESVTRASKSTKLHIVVKIKAYWLLITKFFG